VWWYDAEAARRHGAAGIPAAAAARPRRHCAIVGFWVYGRKSAGGDGLGWWTWQAVVLGRSELSL